VSGVRASDAERDEVVAKLTEEFAAGRLSQDTFLFRMGAVLEARHQADLPPLLADLPSAAAEPVSPGSGAPVPPEPGAPALRGSGAPDAPGSPAPPASAPAVPTPPPLPAAAAAAAAVPERGAPGGPWPAGRPSSLASRLRGALPRRNGIAPTQAGNPPPHGSSPVRRLTSGMPRAAAEPQGPAPLQFPRGEGTHFSIGRDASCDLAISDMTVSRVHARLERTEDGWLLTDLASTNGTRVNGWRVRGQVQVQAGDLVSFGNAEYSLSAADAT